MQQQSGSTEPLRVAITSPSSGVKPMVVSTLRPAAMAQREQPAPRWQLISFRVCRCGLGEAGGDHLGDVLVAEPVEAETPQPWRRQSAGMA